MSKAPSLLTNEEKQAIKAANPSPPYKILAATIARVFSARPGEQWNYTGNCGALVLVKEEPLLDDETKRRIKQRGERVPKFSYLRLVSLGGSGGGPPILWEQELYRGFEFTQLKPFFFTVIGDEHVFGLDFADETEAAAFAAKVVRRIATMAERKRPADSAAGPQASRRDRRAGGGGSGSVTETQRMLDLDDAKYRKLVKALAAYKISEDTLDNPETAAFIKKFVTMNGSVDNVIGEKKSPPPPPPPRRAAPPPPPPRNRAQKQAPLPPPPPPPQREPRPVSPAPHAPPPPPRRPHKSPSPERRPSGEQRGREAQQQAPPPPPSAPPVPLQMPAPSAPPAPPQMPAPSAPPLPPALPRSTVPDAPPVPPPAPPIQQSTPSPPMPPALPPVPPAQMGPPAPPTLPPQGPPPPPGGPPPPPLPTAGNSGGEEKRGMLLSSIRGFGGVNSLRKADKSASSRASISSAHQASKSPGDSSPSAKPEGGDLTSALGAALAARRGALRNDANSDSDSDSDEW